MVYNINFQPRDRIHYICNELLTTEESYVERLKVLVEVRKINALYWEVNAKKYKPSTFI